MSNLISSQEEEVNFSSTILELKYKTQEKKNLMSPTHSQMMMTDI